MRTTKMRIGIIGCGEIGSLRAAALKPSWHLQAVSDVDESRGAAICRRYGGDFERDWRSLAERQDLDAILICTPPNLHAEMCMSALNAGKHVLCEKPLARTSAECHAILDAAAKNNRFVATGFNHRFFPSIQKARALFDAGLIGALQYIRGYAGDWAADHSHSWIHDPEVMGGGALRDIGSHLIDITRYFSGEVTEAHGLASNSVWQFPGCEDNGFLLLRNSTGKIAQLHASWTEGKGYRFVIEIYGTRGYLRVSCFPMLTRVMWTDDRHSKHKSLYWFPLTLLMEHLRSYRWVVRRSFVQELKAFAAAIKGESTTLATGQDGLRAIEIAETVKEIIVPC